MHRFSPLTTVALPFFIALAGCAVSDDEAAPEITGETAAALSGRPLTAADCKDFVAKHPFTSTTTLSTGVAVGTPFRGCDLNSGAIFGTIDFAFAQQLMAGTGRVPIQVRQFGKPPMGLARLYFVNYLTTDLGAYNEFIFLVDGVDENASADAKVLSWVGPTSALLPAFDPKTRSLTPRLILSKQATTPIAYGREILGLDKRGGTVDIVNTSSSMTFSVKDEQGKPVVRGALRPDKSLVGLLAASARLVGAAVGELVTPADLELKLHPLTLNQPIEVSALSFSRDPLASGEIAQMKTTYWWFPSMNDVTWWNIDFALDRSSELGKQLSDAHFTPAAFVTADHVSITSVPR